jgi:type VI secretion system protein ImpL
MLSQAADASEPVRFNRLYSGSARAVSSSYEIPAAFTERGWTFMEQALADVDQFLTGAYWVLGDEVRVRGDRVALPDELRSRYRADYSRHWRSYLTSASVVRFSNINDAADKLELLSSSRSPLLQLLSLAAQHTAVDSQTIGREFQPVHVVTPPDVTGRLVNEINQSYMQGLIALHSSMEQMANAGPARRESLIGQVEGDARTAKNAADQLRLSFAGNEEVGATTHRLLRDPIESAEGLLHGLPARTLNARAAQFCRGYDRLMDKYPFDAAATDEATLEEVSEIFQPQSGALHTFNAEVHQSRLPPSSAFVDFVNRASNVTQALWQSGADEPRMRFALKPLLSDALPAVTFSFDGRTAQFTQRVAGTRSFSWEGSSAREVWVRGQVRGREEILREHHGPWAIFRLFQAGSWRASGGKHVVTWSFSVQGQTVTLEAEVDLAGAPLVFASDYLAGIRNCPRRVVR